MKEPCLIKMITTNYRDVVKPAKQDQPRRKAPKNWDPEVILEVETSRVVLHKWRLYEEASAMNRSCSLFMFVEGWVSNRSCDVTHNDTCPIIMFICLITAPAGSCRAVMSLRYLTAKLAQQVGTTY